MSGHVVLVGLSGSGKSTIGRLLSVHMGRPFYDTDALVAARAGRPVPDLVRDDPAFFRRLEEEVVSDLARAQAGIVATGGGVVLSARNRATLGDGNLVIWLHAPVETLAARLTAGEERPLLGGDALARLAEMARARRDLYQACAHRSIDTASLTPQGAVALLAAMLQEWEAVHA